VCALLAAGSVFLSMGSENWLINSLSTGPELQVRRVVETRQGIVVSYQDDKLGDVIYGGNVYDGRANIDPRINSNGINRVLVLAALRPKAKRVLVLGLSIGSWLYLIKGFPGVEHIDVIEINPAYLDLITDYKKQNEALADPHVHLHIADGRKFLRSVPVGSYDLIIMNTTWHWRAYTSMLLSQEFLRLLRSRLTPDGLAAFNTTGSPDALNTAASVFPHAYLYDNFAVCAGFDWRVLLGDPASVEALLGVMPETTPLLSEIDRPLLSALLSPSHIATAGQVAAKTPRPLEIITDRNLITEYRYGQ
jgi:spermidine synthase